MTKKRVLTAIGIAAGSAWAVLLICAFVAHDYVRNVFPICLLSTVSMIISIFAFMASHSVRPDTQGFPVLPAKHKDQQPSDSRDVAADD